MSELVTQETSDGITGHVRLKPLSLLIAGFSFLVIAAAWGFELIGGYQPCGLCLQQRIPYYIGVPIAALAVILVYRGANRRTLLALFSAIGLVFAVSAFLAIRHAGVEWGWWLGPANCATGEPVSLAPGTSLLEALENTSTVYCDQTAVRFLGLSFAGWNALASLFLVGLSLFTINRLRHAHH